MPSCKTPVWGRESVVLKHLEYKDLCFGTHLFFTAVPCTPVMMSTQDNWGGGSPAITNMLVLAVVDSAGWRVCGDKLQGASSDAWAVPQ